MAFYTNRAPKCAYPGCSNKVSYHKKNGLFKNWKTFCSEHRNSKKYQVDAWKLSKGCCNVDSRYGFKCTSHITSPTQLDVHHKDGDKFNSNPDNHEIICKICHTRVGYESNHHLQRYSYEIELPSDLWEVCDAA